MQNEKHPPNPPDNNGNVQETQPATGEALEELKKKADERDLYRNELLRAKADLENFQKRVRKERPAWEEQAVRRFLRDLLPVVDNLERALAHTGLESDVGGRLDEGVRLTQQMLRQVLIDHGVEEIEAQDRAFDPTLHEAVSAVEVSDRPTGQVVEVLEKGYRHRDVVLRPSRVNVSRSTEDAEQSVDSRTKDGEDHER
jgi:molecular chaperone GrpE